MNKCSCGADSCHETRGCHAWYCDSLKPEIQEESISIKNGVYYYKKYGLYLCTTCAAVWQTEKIASECDHDNYYTRPEWLPKNLPYYDKQNQLYLCRICGAAWGNRENAKKCNHHISLAKYPSLLP